MVSNMAYRNDMRGSTHVAGLSPKHNQLNLAKLGQGNQVNPGLLDMERLGDTGGRVV